MDGNGYREKAAEDLRLRSESQDRSDTDGFLSQWAHGITAALNFAKADLADAGWRHQFPGLFDAQGRRIRAKLITTKGFDGRPTSCWVTVDAQGRYGGFIGRAGDPFEDRPPSPRSKMAKWGLHEALEWAPADAKIVGGASASQVWTFRTDDGYPADALEWEG